VNGSLVVVVVVVVVEVNAALAARDDEDGEEVVVGERLYFRCEGKVNNLILLRFADAATKHSAAITP
jgi:hypothetical protein